MVEVANYHMNSFWNIFNWWWLIKLSLQGRYSVTTYSKEIPFIIHDLILDLFSYNFCKQNNKEVRVVTCSFYLTGVLDIRLYILTVSVISVWIKFEAWVTSVTLSGVTWLKPSMTYDCKLSSINSVTLRCHHACMCEEMGMGWTEEPLVLDNRFPVYAALNGIIHTH